MNGIAINRQDFLARFVGTRVERRGGELSVVLPEATSPDTAELSRDTSEKLAVQAARKIGEMSAMGVSPGLPVLVSAALLKAMSGAHPPQFPAHPRPADQGPPDAATRREMERQSRILDTLNDVSGQAHRAEFILHPEVGPASASVETVWLNPQLAGRAFGSDSVLALALAHEKSHIANGDTTWEPAAADLLWSAMQEAYERASIEGDLETTRPLEEGMEALEHSFAANTRVNEVEADLEALKLLHKAGIDRKPGLAFLLRTAPSGSHPGGPERLQLLRHHLAGTELAISDREMQEIQSLAVSST